MPKRASFFDWTGTMLNFSKLKPGVSRSLHLLTASLLWTFIGLLLMYRGWTFLGDRMSVWLLMVGLAAGTIKSFLILDHSFNRNIQRILQLRDGTCLGAVYSWKLWTLVLIMIIGGYLLRTFTNPGLLAGLLYIGVGWGLFLSSRLGWSALFRHLGR